MALGWAWRQRVTRLTALEALRATPLAVVLAASIAGVLAVGMHLSNAFPSAEQPFGWPGPTRFEYGVAMVRPQLVLATALPPLLMGLQTLRRLDPSRHGVGVVWAVIGANLTLIGLAVCIAGWIGVSVARETADGSWTGFVLAHALLALAFYMVAVMATSLLRGHGAAVAGGLFVGALAIYDQFLQLRLFRQVGYHGLQAGDFPTWFFAAQALSPTTAYRGILILWEPMFMDWAEQAALGKAALPGWLTPTTMAILLAALWIALPLLVTTIAWAIRSRRRRRAPAPAASTAATPA